MGTTCADVANAANIILLNLTFNPSTLPYRYTGAFRSKISKLAAYSFDSQTEIYVTWVLMIYLIGMSSVLGSAALDFGQINS